MIVDTSALIALIQHEPAAEQVAAALAGARSPAVGAGTLTDPLMVLTARQGPVARTVFDRLRSEINLGLAEFTSDHALLAHEPLLAIGNDFPQTDLEFGDGIVGYWPTPQASPP